MNENPSSSIFLSLMRRRPLSDTRPIIIDIDTTTATTDARCHYRRYPRPHRRRRRRLC